MTEETDNKTLRDMALALSAAHAVLGLPNNMILNEIMGRLVFGISSQHDFTYQITKGEPSFSSDELVWHLIMRPFGSTCSSFTEIFQCAVELLKGKHPQDLLGKHAAGTQADFSLLEAHND